MFNKTLLITFKNAVCYDQMTALKFNKHLRERYISRWSAVEENVNVSNWGEKKNSVSDHKLNC